MTDELEKLERAFGKQKAQPRVEAKASAISAAMRAFEEEKISPIFQGMEDDERLNRQGGKPRTLSKWRRLMNTLNSKWAYSFAGGASVAVLAMMIVGPNVSDLLRDVPSDVTFTKKTERQASENADFSEQLPVAGRDNDSAVDDASGVNGGATALSDIVEQDAAPVVVQEEVAISKPAAKLRKEDRLRSSTSQPRNQLSQLSNDSSALGVAPTAKQVQEYSRVASQPAPVDVLTPQYKDQGRDKFEEIKTNPVKVVTEEPVSTFSVDVDTASYAFMRASINNNVLPQKDAVRVEELINYFDYDYEVPADKSEPFKANVEIMPTPWNEGTKLMSIGIKGYELQRDEAPAANLVFLIDTSGSMNAPNKLPLLRNSFKLLLSTLKPDDTVSIVTYAGSAGTALEPTKAAEKTKILAALDTLYAGGSTAGAEGIRQAYKLAETNLKNDGINRVILATDGDFNVGISNPEELKSYIERKRETGVTLSVLGFGQGNYNDQLMQKLAQNGNGNASYIDTLSEARKVLVEEAGSTLFSIAKDVKLQVEFNPALVSEYRLIGYETRALNREDFNNDKVDAGDIGAGHTVTALYEITPANSDAKLVDDLRYGENQTTFAGDATEYGFLKIRYKLPDSDTSTLMTRPVTVADEVSSQSAASENSRFSASVAAFGQLLRGGQYTKSYAYDDVIALARTAKGEDEFGYRAEFINLVRLAKTADGLQAPIE